MSFHFISFHFIYFLQRRLMFRPRQVGDHRHKRPPAFHGRVGSVPGAGVHPAGRAVRGAAAPGLVLCRHGVQRPVLGAHRAHLPGSRESERKKKKKKKKKK